MHARPWSMDYYLRLMIRSVLFVNYEFDLRNMFIFTIDGQWLIVDEFNMISNATWLGWYALHIHLDLGSTQSFHHRLMSQLRSGVLWGSHLSSIGLHQNPVKFIQVCRCPFQFQCGDTRIHHGCGQSSWECLRLPWVGCHQMPSGPYQSIVMDI